MIYFHSGFPAGPSSPLVIFGISKSGRFSFTLIYQLRNFEILPRSYLSGFAGIPSLDHIKSADFFYYFDQNIPLIGGAAKYACIVHGNGARIRTLLFTSKQLLAIHVHYQEFRTKSQVLKVLTHPDITLNSRQTQFIEYPLYAQFIEYPLYPHISSSYQLQTKNQILDSKYTYINHPHIPGYISMNPNYIPIRALGASSIKPTSWLVKALSPDFCW